MLKFVKTYLFSFDHFKHSNDNMLKLNKIQKHFKKCYVSTREQVPD